MKTYIYFVSYQFTDTEGGWGLGNMQASMPDEITTFQHIRQIEQGIKDGTGSEDANVLNYQLLRIDEVSA